MDEPDGVGAGADSFEFGGGRKPGAPDEDPDFVILCVPGTFARRDDEGDSWFKGGELTLSGKGFEGDLPAQLAQTALKDILNDLFARRGDDPEPLRIRVETLNWYRRPKKGADSSRVGGGPTAKDRNRGADDLRKRLTFWASERKIRCLIVAHSHGGNIAIRAVRNLAVRPFSNAYQRVRGVITIGSPLYFQGFNPFRRAIFGKPFLPTHAAVWMSAVLAYLASPWARDGLTSGSIGQLAATGLLGGWGVILVMRTMVSLLKSGLAATRMRGDIRLTEISAPQDEVAGLFPTLIRHRASKGFSLKIAAIKAVMRLRDLFPVLPISAALVALAVWLQHFGWEAPILTRLAEGGGFGDLLIGLMAVLLPLMLAKIVGGQGEFETFVAQVVYGSQNRILREADIRWPKQHGRTLAKKVPDEVQRLVAMRVAGAGYDFGEKFREALNKVRTQKVRGLVEAAESIQDAIGSKALFHNAYFSSACFRLYLSMAVAKAMDFDIRLRTANDTIPREFENGEFFRGTEARRVDSRWLAIQAALIDLNGAFENLTESIDSSEADGASVDAIAALKGLDLASWSGSEVEAASPERQRRSGPDAVLA